MKKHLVNLTSVVLVALMGLTLVSCGTKEAVFSMTLGTEAVLENNDLFNEGLKEKYADSNGNSELQYDLIVNLDGIENYTVEKTLKSLGENDEMGIDVTYTYKGIYTLNDNELALDAPDFVSINNDWGVLANFVGFHDGNATSDDFDSLLRGFASLYLTTYGDFGITLEVNENQEIVKLINIYTDEFVETEYIIDNPVDGYDPIYGKLVLPREYTGVLPMVSIAHGMNRSYKDKVYNARAYAAAGIGAYVFNYDSGSAPFDVCKQEVEAVFENLKTLDFVDTNNIFMSGYSYGGMLSSLIAAERAVDATQNDVRGLILVYPALSSSNNFAQITAFEGPVIIFHGSNDGTIPLATIIAGAAAYGDNAELVIIEGGEHGKFMKFEEICYPGMIEFINESIQ